MNIVILDWTIQWTRSVINKRISKAIPNCIGRNWLSLSEERDSKIIPFRKLI